MVIQLSRLNMEDKRMLGVTGMGRGGTKKKVLRKRRRSSIRVREIIRRDTTSLHEPSSEEREIRHGEFDRKKGLYMRKKLTAKGYGKGSHCMSPPSPLPEQEEVKKESGSSLSTRGKENEDERLEECHSDAQFTSQRNMRKFLGKERVEVARSKGQGTRT